jgi:hypothetical protein
MAEKPLIKQFYPKTAAVHRRAILLSPLFVQLRCHQQNFTINGSSHNKGSSRRRPGLGKLNTIQNSVLESLWYRFLQIISQKMLKILSLNQKPAVTHPPTLT